MVISDHSEANAPKNTHRTYIRAVLESVDDPRLSFRVLEVVHHTAKSPRSRIDPVKRDDVML